MSSLMVAESETAGLTSVVKDSLISLPGHRRTNVRICVSASFVVTSDFGKRLGGSEQARRRILRYSSLHASFTPDSPVAFHSLWWVGQSRGAVNAFECGC